MRLRLTNTDMIFAQAWLSARFICHVAFSKKDDMF